MTLFARATAENQVFEDALHKYFSGQADQFTIQVLTTAGDQPKP